MAVGYFPGPCPGGRRAGAARCLLGAHDRGAGGAKDVVIGRSALPMASVRAEARQHAASARCLLLGERTQARKRESARPAAPAATASRRISNDSGGCRPGRAAEMAAGGPGGWPARPARRRAATNVGSMPWGPDLLAGVRHLANGLVPLTSGRTEHHGHPQLGDGPSGRSTMAGTIEAASFDEALKCLLSYSDQICAPMRGPDKRTSRPIPTLLACSSVDSCGHNLRLPWGHSRDARLRAYESAARQASASESPRDCWRL
jgi:hypothetical protein